MPNKFAIVTFLSVILYPLGAVAEANGDSTAGEKLYRQCAACHMIGKDAANRVGPQLNDIVGRAAGTVEGARYSPALLEAGADGLVWTPETLDAYIADPRGYIRGSRMSYRGMPDADDRLDLIAFLQSFTSDAQDAATTAGFAVAAEILAITGDFAYGEYLSSECTACHQASGADSGIPSITGWAEPDFVTAMHAYKEAAREHPVMQMMASRLSNEEIAALAAYFKAVE